MGLSMNSVPSPLVCLWLLGWSRKNWKERNAFLAALETRKTWPAIVHNNWLEGYKLKLNRFKEYNIWFLNDTR